jgi:hypothetical protein
MSTVRDSLILADVDGSSQISTRRAITPRFMKRMLSCVYQSLQLTSALQFRIALGLNSAATINRKSRTPSLEADLICGFCRVVIIDTLTDNHRRTNESSCCCDFENRGERVPTASRVGIIVVWTRQLRMKRNSNKISVQ